MLLPFYVPSYLVVMRSVPITGWTSGICGSFGVFLESRIGEVPLERVHGAVEVNLVDVSRKR